MRYAIKIITAKGSTQAININRLLKIVTKRLTEALKPSDILSIAVSKDKATTDKYGEIGKDGVIEVALKKGETNNTENNLIIAPNPAKDNVQVTLKGSVTNNSLNVLIYDKFGKVVYSDKKTGSTFSLSVSSLKTDSYIVTVSDGTNTYHGNLVVQ